MIENIQILSSSPLGWIATLCLGLIWGSFFNVLIYRLPKDEGVVTKRSYCPKCHKLIPWYHNVPVLSYLWLKGKCANCRKKISIQYPLVELSTMAIYLWLFHYYGFGIPFLGYAIFLSSLLVISVIDLHHRIIPDELSLSGIVLGWVFNLILGQLPWWDPLAGILLGGGSFFLIAYGYEKLAGREGLGGGDIKLLAMIGAWLGYRSILIVVVVSSALGSVIGLSFMLFRKKDFKTEIPFGPFLAIGALVYLFWGGYIEQFLLPDPSLSY